MVPGRTDSTINQSNHEQKRPFCQDYFGKTSSKGFPSETKEPVSQIAAFLEIFYHESKVTSRVRFLAVHKLLEPHPTEAILILAERCESM